MKVGSIVRWIGYPNHTDAPGPLCLGIVTKVWDVTSPQRVDVFWADGTMGAILYPETLEVIK